ncbi:MAG: DUF2892 domain-containing protein [Rudanella sp.]|nr:DUF2892 domain-containing protein [Rudanella sp.]
MNFVKNVGFVDQVVRAMLVIDVVAAYLMGFLAGFGAFLAAIAAVTLVGSCLTAHCPLYMILGYTTRQEYGDRRQ